MASGELSWHFSSILLMEHILLTSWAWQFLSLFIGFYTSQVVSRISSINRIILPTHRSPFSKDGCRFWGGVKDNHLFLTCSTWSIQEMSIQIYLWTKNLNSKTKRRQELWSHAITPLFHLRPSWRRKTPPPFSATKCGGRKVLNTNLLSQKTLGSGQTPKWP